MENKLKLIYVDSIGKNSDNKYEYEFFFSEDIKDIWGENWDCDYPNFGGDMKPYKECYSVIKRLITDIPFSCIQNNTCFSMQHCIDGCVSVCYENISNYEEYPEPYRIVFQFGEDIDSIIEKLQGREINFE